MEDQTKYQFSVVESAWRNCFSGGLYVTLQIIFLGIFFIVLASLLIFGDLMIFPLISIFGFAVSLNILKRVERYTLSYKKVADTFLEFFDENIIVNKGNNRQYFPLHKISDLSIHYHENSLENASSRILWKYQTQVYEYEIAIESPEESDILLNCVRELYQNGIKLQECDKNGVPTYLLKVKGHGFMDKNLEELIGKIGEE